MSDGPRLYDLLPPLYRRLDAASPDQPLAALAASLDEGRDTIEQDIAALYRDWFVDTAAPDVLPLLAGLVGIDIPAGTADPRRLVAEAVGVARAKGTAGAAERRLAALAGWPVRIGMADDRYRALIEVFTQRVVPIEYATPYELALPGDGSGARLYRFHPIGVDVPLYRPGMADRPPLPLLTADGAAGSDPHDWRTAFAIHLQDEDRIWRTLPVEAISAADLGGEETGGGADGDQVLVDPRLGRFALLPAAGPFLDVAVSFGWAAEPGLGGGAASGAPAAAPARTPWRAYVTRHAEPAADRPPVLDLAARASLADEPPVFASVAEALAAFRSVPTAGEIRILDSATYDIGGCAIETPTDLCPADLEEPRALAILAVDGVSPCLRGELTVTGARTGLDLAIEGLWIDGRIRVDGAAAVRLTRCSVRAAPVLGDGAAITLTESDSAAPRLELVDTLVGPLRLGPHCIVVSRDSVIDGDGDKAIAGGGEAILAQTTVLGIVAAAAVEAVDAFFSAPLAAATDRGALIACVVQDGSVGPPLSRCVTGGDARAYRFAATRLGLPGYARLDQAGPAIRTGAVDGGEIGAGHAFRVAERLALLETQAPEVLPFGLPWEIVVW